jgi:formate hydrogenlyase subunit 3/multisubunit Na+/H+ antiporter MnhD subunit
MTPDLFLSLSVDRLTTFFILVISIVALSVGVFSPGYLSHVESEFKRSFVISVMCLFVVSMRLLVTARDIFTFRAQR